MQNVVWDGLGEHVIVNGVVKGESIGGAEELELELEFLAGVVRGL